MCGKPRLDQPTPAAAGVGGEHSELKLIDLSGDHEMSSTMRSRTTKTTKLLLYFWLPAGRDEFEFASCDYSPFRNAAKYRDDIEETIAKRLMGKLPDNSPGMLLSGDPHLQDAALGLRKVEFEFRYERAPQVLNFPNELTGSALILSNGLYLWRFDFEYPSELSDKEVAEAAKGFLREDFVERHIARLFKFEWAEHESDALSLYDGILTYYQIDLLFNGLFDKDAHPHNFMNPRPANKGALYDVRGIIQSASLFAIKNHHSPLFGELDDISLDTVSRKASESPISTEIELFGTEWDTEKAEQLLSRVSHAGMEQFLKSAISFSLIHYKAGLDHCRAQLTNDSLLIRINKTAGELRRPSLSAVLSSADLQSYTSIVAGKLPTFIFLHSLIKDLARASRPFEAQSGNKLDGPGWAEWIYSRSTLRDTLLHYKLYVESVREDISEINRSLATGRTDQVIAELTDARKIAEIASESPKKIIYERSGREMDTLMVRFTLVALIFSFVQAYASVGVWAMDRLLSGNGGQGLLPGGVRWWQALIGFGQWIVVLLVLALIYQKLGKRSARGTASGDSNESSKDETHVFDYSFFHEKLKDRSAEMINKLAESMPSIEPTGKPSGCASRSSFRETPLSAVERTKYTLESRDSPLGSYIFYIEVDRRMNTADEYLREVRLVLKKPAGKQYFANGKQYSIKECAQHIICDCVKSLDFDDDQGKVLELLEEQFE